MYNICFEFGLNQRFQVYLTKHLQEAIYQIDETTLMISGPEEKETKEHQDCIYNSCELSNCDYLFKLCEAIFAGINLIIWQFHLNTLSYISFWAEQQIPIYLSSHLWLQNMFELVKYQNSRYCIFINFNSHYFFCFRCNNDDMI